MSVLSPVSSCAGAHGESALRKLLIIASLLILQGVLHHLTVESYGSHVNLVGVFVHQCCVSIRYPGVGEGHEWRDLLLNRASLRNNTADDIRRYISRLVLLIWLVGTFRRHAFHSEC